VLVSVVLILMPALLSSTRAQQPAGRALVFPVTIQWNKQKAVRGYRLQIAADEAFRDVFLDKRVVGERYVVCELGPGYYYWRVAAAEPQLGYYSRPAKFFVPGGIVTKVVPTRSTRTRLFPRILISRSRTRVR